MVSQKKKKKNIQNIMWHYLPLMNFINLTNEYLYHFFVINNMTICKLIIKFIIFLTSLIKKIVQPLKIYIIL